MRLSIVFANFLSLPYDFCRLYVFCDFCDLPLSVFWRRRSRSFLCDLCTLFVLNFLNVCFSFSLSPSRLILFRNPPVCVCSSHVKRVPPNAPNSSARSRCAPEPLLFENSFRFFLGISSCAPLRVSCVTSCVPFHLSTLIKPGADCVPECRNTFNVDPDTHIDSIKAAEQVILAGDWSAKLTITGG